MTNMCLTYTAGLELARLADLPANVLTESKRVAETLAELHARQKEDSKSSKIAMRRKALLRVISFLPLGFSWICGHRCLYLLTLNPTFIVANPTHASSGPFCTPRSRPARLYSPVPNRYYQGLFECLLTISIRLWIPAYQTHNTPASDTNPLLFLFNVALKASVPALFGRLRICL